MASAHSQAPGRVCAGGGASLAAMLPGRLNASVRARVLTSDLGELNVMVAAMAGQRRATVLMLESDRLRADAVRRKLILSDLDRHVLIGVTSDLAALSDRWRRRQHAGGPLQGLTDVLLLGVGPGLQLLAAQVSGIGCALPMEALVVELGGRTVACSTEGVLVAPSHHPLSQRSRTVAPH